MSRPLGLKRCSDCVHSRRKWWDILLNPLNRGWHYATCDHPAAWRIIPIVNPHLGGSTDERTSFFCSTMRKSEGLCGLDARYHEEKQR